VRDGKYPIFALVLVGKLTRVAWLVWLQRPDNYSNDDFYNGSHYHSHSHSHSHQHLFEQRLVRTVCRPTTCDHNTGSRRICLLADSTYCDTDVLVNRRSFQYITFIQIQFLNCKLPLSTSSTDLTNLDHLPH
jgi:hypothetical protein